MPIQTCKEENRPGFRWGRQGKCYTYSPDNEASKKRAKLKAIKQGIAASGGPAGFKREQAKGEATEDEIQEAIAEYISELPNKDRLTARLNKELENADDNGTT